MKLSIVSTLYRSEPFLREFYDRIKAAAETIDPQFELILVDDGSPDRSLEVALELKKNDPRLKIVELSRNFGHHKAIMTGLSLAQGDTIFLIDSDLEEEPEWLRLFHNALGSDDRIDVIFGQQTKRKGSWSEKFTGALFYTLFRALTDQDLPRNMVTARLMRRAYVEQLVQHQERSLFLGGLFAITGFHQKALPIEKKHKHSSTYTLKKKITLTVDAITSFSSKPLAYIFYLGCGIFSVSFLIMLYALFQKIFLGATLSGWTSLILSIWMLGGLTIFSIGVLGIYISKSFIENKKRPYTIIRRIY